MVAIPLPRGRPALVPARPGVGAAAVAVVALAWIVLLVGPGHHRTGPADLPQWTVMVVAMMGPAALPGIRHTARNSLRWRRGRAAAEFGLGYLAVWVGYGAVVLLLPPVPVGAVLLVAAGWQLTPYKRRWMLECHRGRPLPPAGPAADRAAAGFGLRVGGACAGSCWALMLVTPFAPMNLVWTAGLAGLVLAERLTRHPVRTTRIAALGLAALAFAVLLPTLT
jgi:predicted metal-binding membrane protein